MATEKGWFIKSKEPNDIYFSLQADVENGWTTDLTKALLFAREIDADSYFAQHFHPTARDQYEVDGIN